MPCLQEFSIRRLCIDAARADKGGDRFDCYVCTSAHSPHSPPASRSAAQGVYRLSVRFTLFRKYACCRLYVRTRLFRDLRLRVGVYGRKFNWIAWHSYIIYTIE